MAAPARGGDPTPAAMAPALAPVRQGFDHLVHEGRLAASGGDELACSACHRLDRRGLLVGRPGHALCFGSCHGPVPSGPPDKDLALTEPDGATPRADVCAACHAPATLVAPSRRRARARSLAVAYPPYDVDPDYGLALSHAAHAQAPCAGCHAAVAAAPIYDPRARVAATGERSLRSPTPLRGSGSPRAAAAHARCTGCHLAPLVATTPAMTDCARCHPAAYGPARAPRMLEPTYPVTPAFGHERHQARAGAVACLACHAEIAAATGLDLPRPTTAGCASCHDDVRAFSTTGVSCTRCHSRPPVQPVRRPPPQTRYDHALHREAGVVEQCNACHPVAADGGLGAIATDHRPCADAGCHQDDFSATAPVTCGVCHSGAEPWRHLHVDAVGLGATSFGARFSHRAHLGGDAPRVTAPCAGCHRESSRGGESRPPPDHAACAGTGCHDRDALPRFADCASCHEADLLGTHERRRGERAWSVRARFGHAAHATDPRDGSALACQACHDGIVETTGLDDIPTPAKATCAPCHDGALAFKLTGHGCARCHAQP